MKKTLFLALLLLLTCGLSTAQQQVVYSQTYSPVPAPTTPTLYTSTTGGVLTAQTYRLCITYFTLANNESMCSTDTSATITTTGTTSTVYINAPGAPIASGMGPNVVGYRVYVSAGASGSEKLQTMTAAQCTLAASSTAACSITSGYVLNVTMLAVTAIPTASTAYSPEIGRAPGISEAILGVYVHHLAWTVSGTVSTCTTAIDSAPDNLTWSAGGVMAAQTCTAGGAFSTSGVTANYIALNVTALTSSNGTASLTVTYYGDYSSIYQSPLRGYFIVSGTITPAATSAAIQTVAQAFTLTGLEPTDRVFLISQPAPTSLCPVTSVGVAAVNSVNLYFTVLTAAACTPAAGVFTFGIIR
jgi:hypothetical protein